MSWGRGTRDHPQCLRTPILEKPLPLSSGAARLVAGTKAQDHTTWEESAVLVPHHCGFGQVTTIYLSFQVCKIRIRIMPTSYVSISREYINVKSLK